MTQSAKVITLEVGTEVINNLPSGEVRRGVVVEGGKVEFERDGKKFKALISERWTAVEAAPAAEVLEAVLTGSASPEASEASAASAATVLDAVLEASEPAKAKGKGKGKKTGEASEAGEEKGEAAPAPEAAELPAEPLTAEEKKRLAKLEKDFFNFEKQTEEFLKKIHFQKGEVLDEIRIGKLYRETHKTFAEYAKEKFGVTREYAQNLAQIGAFKKTASELLDSKDIVFSVRATNALISGGNKLAEGLGLEKGSREITPILNDVLEMTVAATKGENGKAEPTGKQVEAINALVAEKLRGVEAGEGGSVIDRAREVLKESKADILAKYRAALETGSAAPTGKKGSGGIEKLGVYTGPAPVLTVACSLHPEQENQKILQYGNGWIRLKCGCKFKGIGFETVAFEVEGKAIKAAK